MSFNERTGASSSEGSVGELECSSVGSLPTFFLGGSIKSKWSEEVHKEVHSNS